MTTSTELKAKVEELRQAQRDTKEAADLKEWEDRTSERNPAFVRGSVRRPNAEEVAALGHCHGLVCTIRCLSCGQGRMVNKQDAFQARFCKECVKEVKKEAKKEQRLVKKANGKSIEDIEKEIESLKQLLIAKVA